MNSIGSLLENRTVTVQATETPPLFQMRSPRDEGVQRFLGRGIKIRDPKTKQIRLATAAELALILRHCPTTDLYPFFRKCEGARSFSKFFWWAVKRRRSQLA